MIILLIWVAVLIAVIILYLRQLYSRFNKYGVKYLRPYPLVGNMDQILLRKVHMVDDIANLYNNFPEERFVGRFEFLTELVLIRDLELAKKITVKDFEYFLDHRMSLIAKDEGSFLFERNLFFMGGEDWKDMRSTLSPAFTSSKMRLMIPYMVEVGDQMMKSLKNKLEASEGFIDLDCKDLTTRYANDVIAYCAFGIKVDSNADENNEFYTNGKKAATFGFQQFVKFFLLTNFPKIAKYFNVELFTESSKNFLRSIVGNTMKERELKKIVRPDMINLLLEAKRGKVIHEKSENKADTGFATVEESDIGKQHVKRSWSDDVLIAQAAVFFVAGFDGVSTVMCFLLYELALNTDVQEKLAQEIREHDAKNKGKFDFNSIQSMVYMDMVVSELLRLWTPAAFVDRLCTKDYNIGKPNANSERDFIIRKGSAVIIPICGFHRDPNLFPNPDKFDPERFSEENRDKIHPFSYLPFGAGPRNCIGSRFALCEIKVITYQILKHLEVSPCERTCIPAQLTLESFNLQLKGGHWLRFKARKQN